MVDYYAFDNTQDNLVGMKGKLKSEKSLNLSRYDTID